MIVPILLAGSLSIAGFIGIQFTTRRFYRKRALQRMLPAKREVHPVSRLLVVAAFRESASAVEVLDLIERHQLTCMGSYILEIERFHVSPDVRVRARQLRRQLFSCHRDSL